MASPEKKSTAILVKKKNWYEIAAPAMFSNQYVGETHLGDSNEAIGRVLKVNLMSITNNPKDQGINIKLEITDYKDGKLNTNMVGYYLTTASIKRFVRRGRDRVDESFACKTSDNKILVVKPLLITKSKTKNSILTALRKETIKKITEHASKNTYENFLKDIFSNRLINSLKGHLKNIYPLKNVSIRTMELSKKERRVVTEEEKPKEKKKAEEEEQGEKKEAKKKEPKVRKEDTKEKKKDDNDKEISEDLKDDSDA